MKQEVELKILLDAAAEARLRRNPAVNTLAQGEKPETKTLVSIYYDTPDRRLAAAGFAVRLRKSGRSWLQTVKRGRGLTAGLSTPEEAEGPAPGARLDIAALDPDLAAAVEAARGDQPLSPVFETRMRRRTHQLMLPGGQVELALDTGSLVAGDREAEMAEAEMELVSGDPGAVFEAARQLFPEGPLRFSEASKADRGLALADGREPFPVPRPRKARLPEIAGDLAVEPAARIMLGECLDQIATNMLVVQLSDDPEGPHQLRIGLRRLRTVLGALGPVLGGPALAAVGLAAQEIGAEVGSLRDLDVMGSDLLAPIGPGEDVTRLAEALRAAADLRREAVRAMLAGRPATGFLYELGRVIAARGWLDPGDYGQTERLATPIAQVMAAALDKRWRKAAKLGQRIEDLVIDDRHALRKELKKLRYTLEFAAGFFPEKRVARFLKALRALQEVFGSLNDHATAELLLTAPDAPGAGDPVASRAVGRVLGWHGHASLEDWKRAKAGWRGLADEGPFWR